MNEITVALQFIGGPLDGEIRHQQIPADWQILRFEHRRGPKRHAYSGRRTEGDRLISMQYAGVPAMEASR